MYALYNTVYQEFIGLGFIVTDESEYTETTTVVLVAGGDNPYVSTDEAELQRLLDELSENKHSDIPPGTPGNPYVASHKMLTDCIIVQLKVS